MTINYQHISSKIKYNCNGSVCEESENLENEKYSFSAVQQCVRGGEKWRERRRRKMREKEEQRTWLLMNLKSHGKKESMPEKSLTGEC